MKQDTIERLNQINREFYAITAAEFDQTRGRAWAGWQPLADYLTAPLRVLDVGCGNGRFGIWLADTLDGQVTYHGIDNNADLLRYADDALAEIATIDATLTERDIIADSLPDDTYDLVVLFGVIHHVPGNEQRRAFMQRLAERVADGGLLCFAAWRFYAYERFRERLVDWEADLADEVDAHDYLLDWRRGERALRYCHYVDEDEHQALIDATGLTHVTTYRADGSDDAMNRYSILRRGSTVNH